MCSYDNRLKETNITSVISSELGNYNQFKVIIKLCVGFLPNIIVIIIIMANLDYSF